MPNPRIGKNYLDDNLAGDHVGQRQPQRRELRQQGIAQAEAEEDRAIAQAVGLGQRDVILARGRDHHPPHPQRPEADLLQDNGQRRQNRMVQHVEGKGEIEDRQHAG